MPSRNSKEARGNRRGVGAPPARRLPATTRRGRGPSAKTVPQKVIANPVKPKYLPTVRRGRGRLRVPQPVQVKTGGGQIKTMHRKEYLRRTKKRARLIRQRESYLRTLGRDDFASAHPGPKKKSALDTAGDIATGIGSVFKSPTQRLVDAAKLTAHGGDVEAAGLSGDYPVKFARGIYFGGRSFAESGKVRKKTLEAIPRTAAAAIPGLVEAIDNPGRALKAMKKDYETRYGAGSYKDFKKRAEQEGVLAEALDVGAAVGGVGRLAGVGRVAKYGARPLLQESSGRAVAQAPPSKNLFGRQFEHAVDKSREKAMKKRIRTGHPRAALDQEALEAGTVVRKGKRARDRTTRKLDSQIDATLRLEKKAAERNVTRLRRTAARGKVSKEQLHDGPFRFAVELGIRTPDDARMVLPQLRERIVTKRAASEEPDMTWNQDDLPRIDKAVADADRLFTPGLAVLADEAASLSRTLGAFTPSLKGQGARRSRIRAGEPQALAMGIRRGPGEDIDDYLLRRDAAIDDSELARGGYFYHSDADRPASLSFTMGTGARTPGNPQATKYDLFERGRVDPRYERFEEGLMKNVREVALSTRVDQIVKDFVPPALRDINSGVRVPTGRAMSKSQVLNAVQHSGVGDELVPFNPGIVKDAEGALGDLARMADDDQFDQGVAELLSKATDPDNAVDGWYLVDRAAIDNIKESMKGHGIGSRLLRKFGKSMPSKLILGTNPTWALLQVVNNATLAALGGLGNVTKLSRSRKFFKENPDVRTNLEARLGLGALEAEQRSVRLGEAGNQYSKTWEAFKDTSVREHPWLNQANPLNWLFAFDRAQTKAFRESASYNILSRHSRELDQMNEATVQLVGGLDQATALTKLPPDQRMRALAENPDVVEHVGRQVDQLLGNYVRFSAKERRLLENNIMFYGFLRFSLQMAFYILPFKHPLITSLASNLARMHEGEARRLLGLAPGDNLPFEYLGNYYSLDDKGQLRMVGLNRLNPTMNALMQGSGPNQLAAGLMSPFFVEAINQFFSMNMYQGKHWRINGETEDMGIARWGDVGFLERAEMALANVARLSAPYRATEQNYFAGEPQGADSSLLFGAEPTKYKDEDVLTSIELSKMRADSGGRNYLRTLVNPFASRPSFTPDTIGRQNIEELEGDAASIARDRLEQRMIRRDPKAYRKALRKAVKLSIQREVEGEREKARDLKRYLQTH